MVLQAQAQTQQVQNFGDLVEVTVQTFVAALPEILGAILVLILGYIFGKIFAGIARNIMVKTELDEKVMTTPLSRGIGRGERRISIIAAKIVKWFIYAIAILAAASMLNIAILSEWISLVITYIPVLIGGLLIILLGFIFADFIGDMIKRTEATTRTGYTKWFGEGVKIFLYFLAIVIGLDTIGVDVTLLYIFARALAWGTAIGIAVAIGIALGWGGKDYVKDNVEKWMNKMDEETSDRT